MRNAKDLFKELREADPELQAEYDRLAPLAEALDNRIRERQEPKG